MKKHSLSRAVLTSLAAVLLIGVVLVACNGGSSPTAPEPAEADPAPAVASLAYSAPGEEGESVDGSLEVGMTTRARGGSCSGKKVAICHLPPGNPTNIQEICVGGGAVPAHQAHSDYFPLTFWPDDDGDGFGDSSAEAQSGCVVPPGFVEDDTDCDDGDAAVNPDADEILCDLIDNNCNGAADDDVNADGDPVSFCDGDCDDNDATIYPGAPEVLCDSIDNDCNAATDDDVNADGDPVSFCEGDCDDDDATIYPGAPEILCDTIDNDCNAATDDDVNGDGDPVSFCDGDCDDDDSDRYPGNPEICDDGIDNDCDTEVDPPALCGNEPPVAVDDDFVLTSIECVVATCPGGPGLDRTCVLNAPPGTITVNDSDPDSGSFDAMINGPITDVGWACDVDNMCTTDANVNFGASSLTVNADGSFDLVYTTSQNFILGGGPTDVVIAEFLYFLEDPDGNLSGNARVMVPVHCP